jgi:hypothetical protein
MISTRATHHSPPPTPHSLHKHPIASIIEFYNPLHPSHPTNLTPRRTLHCTNSATNMKFRGVRQRECTNAQGTLSHPLRVRNQTHGKFCSNRYCHGARASIPLPLPLTSPCPISPHLLPPTSLRSNNPLGVNNREDVAT